MIDSHPSLRWQTKYWRRSSITTLVKCHVLLGGSWLVCWFFDWLITTWPPLRWWNAEFAFSRQYFPCGIHFFVSLRVKLNDSSIHWQIQDVKQTIRRNSSLLMTSQWHSIMLTLSSSFHCYSRITLPPTGLSLWSSNFLKCSIGQPDYTCTII